MIEVRFDVPVDHVPETHRSQAEREAETAFVLSLLRQGDISAGRAAEVLCLNRKQLSDLMAAHGISPFGDHLTCEQLEREVADALRTPQPGCWVMAGTNGPAR
jgi:hypothetical protein